MNQKSIEINVITHYIEKHSDPNIDKFVFSYTINIHNKGFKAATLINRHWIITDANGEIEEVRGKGVIGEQPHLQPGEYFEYSSGAILKTSMGVMRGNYQMRCDDGELFYTPIPQFTLSVPRILH